MSAPASTPRRCTQPAGAASGCELVANCGRRGWHSEEVACRHGIKGTYTDYREMIDRAGLDAVVVAGPDDARHDVAIEALEAG